MKTVYSQTIGSSDFIHVILMSILIQYASRFSWRIYGPDTSSALSKDVDVGTVHGTCEERKDPLVMDVIDYDISFFNSASHIS